MFFTYEAVVIFKCSVYSEVGVLLQKVKATDDIIRFYLPVNHTYLIKIVNKSFKVAL